MDLLLEILKGRIEKAQSRKKGRVYRWLKDPENKKKLREYIELLLDALDGEDEEQ